MMLLMYLLLPDFPPYPHLHVHTALMMMYYYMHAVDLFCKQIGCSHSKTSYNHSGYGLLPQCSTQPHSSCMQNVQCRHQEKTCFIYNIHKLCSLQRINSHMNRILPVDLCIADVLLYCCYVTTVASIPENLILV